MNEKVILISIDGMRPDGAVGCGHPFVQELMEKSTYTLQGGSVLPPVTLPCHTSMFYGVPPERHGILTNTYTPPVRPVKGIAEQLAASGKVCAAFHNWEPIRHIWQSETMKYTGYINAYQEDNRISSFCIWWKPMKREGTTMVGCLPNIWGSSATPFPVPRGFIRRLAMTTISSSPLIMAAMTAAMEITVLRI